MHIDFPLAIASSGRTASCDDAAHVRDMLEQLLFTNAGERVNRPDVGSGLQQLLFAPNSVELGAALQFTTRGAIQQWLGDVLDLEALDVVVDGEILRIVVRYVLTRTGEPRTETFEQGLP